VGTTGGNTCYSSTTGSPYARFVSGILLKQMGKTRNNVTRKYSVFYAIYSDRASPYP